MIRKVPTGLIGQAIAAIKRAVCEEFEVIPANLTSRSRRRDIARPRQIAMGLVREMTNESFPQIAWLFKRDNHTTVIWAINKFKKLENDPDWGPRILSAREKIKSLLKAGMESAEPTTSTTGE